ncbi:ABC transporter permease [Clostridium septicum]|uniref:ABC transporter permease n=1 Tax=Clostridium septicum TaxID=1504 RepID=A0A9N7JLU8_CLOSE|nr:ABC transporter permease [Clostridium septicum]AYE34117.1 ABC transporter permease [Clostridium septicum]QAS59483.1 ABC transporter permease [Clostridium septicum]UEC21256.1 ABC transporter permease [Clostridium septicum]USS00699.1 ABC transporter permease [Clostridium septicum]WLF69240.1 ABC transporter permease [Clostridium septicum]
MKFRVLIFSALRNLNRNKKRSFLTMLGIIIGIAAVIAIVALGEGYKTKTIKEFTGEDEGKVVLEASLTNEDPSNAMKISGNIFTNSDKTSVAQLEGIEKVDFNYDDNKFGEFISVDVRNKEFQGLAKKVKDGDFKDILGRNLTKSDSESKKRVIVISESLITDKVGKIEDLLGGVATVKGLTFEIVGIMKKAPDEEFSFFNSSGDIQIPEGTYDKYFGKSKTIVGLKITLNKDADVKKSIKSIENTLNQVGTNRSKGKYTVMDTSGIIKLMGGVLNTITLFIAAVAGISLFIAGIGVMNMIYTSVSERTIEIGIKRALGAKKKDIRREFLIEGVVITLTGGLIGYILGIIIANIISAFMKLVITPSLYTASIAIAISILVGTASSILPAKKAASSNTVDILK